MHVLYMNELVARNRIEELHRKADAQRLARLARASKRTTHERKQVRVRLGRPVTVWQRLRTSQSS